MDKLSYALGLSMADNMKKSGLGDINAADFAKGMEAMLSGAKADITLDEAHQIIRTHMAQLQEKQANANKEAGEKFLAENKKKAGIITTESGLQYEVITMGNGPKPKATDTVLCHYHGTLIDGTVFDSSVDRGEPIDFPVNGVIPGWVEALQLMPVGSKWRLYIPSNLGYGEYGAGEAIAPNSALIFDVELIEIK